MINLSFLGCIFFFLLGEFFFFDDPRLLGDFFWGENFPGFFLGGLFETLVIVEGCCWLVRAKKPGWQRWERMIPKPYGFGEVNVCQVCLRLVKIPWVFHHFSRFLNPKGAQESGTEIHLPREVIGIIKSQTGSPFSKNQSRFYGIYMDSKNFFHGSNGLMSKTSKNHYICSPQKLATPKKSGQMSSSDGGFKKKYTKHKAFNSSLKGGQSIVVVPHWVYKCTSTEAVYSPFAISKPHCFVHSLWFFNGMQVKKSILWFGKFPCLPLLIGFPHMRISMFFFYKSLL